MIGRTISHYRVIAKLGEGGMGVVYRAEDLTLNRQVALKFLAKDALAAGQQKRFLNEAKAVARLSHPNICPVHAIEQADGELFLSMALLEGRPLADLMSAGPIPIAEAIDLAIQIGAGLAAAHTQGVVHRDVTPGNVIVGDDGHASILDFGLALIQGHSRLTTVGATVGTAAYMSPEQTLGEKVDGRSDIWSLGVLLYQMVGGQLPFRAEHRMAMLYEVVNENPQSLAEICPDCPTALRVVIERTLAKRVADRYQTAAALVEDLKSIRGEDARAIVGTAPGGSPKVTTAHKALTRLSSWRPNFAQTGSDHTRSVALAAAVVILLMALVVVLFTAGGDSQQAEFPAVKHVAVLPFTTSGGDPQTQALCDGLVEVLTAKLSLLDAVGSLLIVPVSEVRSRGVESVEQARKEFGVNLAITGSVQDWGDVLEFTSTLVDAETLRQIDATTFEIHKGDVTSLRLGAISRVINILQLNLSPSQTVDAAETSIAAAYSAYLEGVGYMHRRDTSGNKERAVESFERAIEQDPDYATAYAWLSEAYYEVAEDNNDVEMAAKAVATAETAVQKDGASAIARAKLGEALARAGRPDDAIRELQRAQELEPRNYEALLSFAKLYPDLQQPELAEAAVRRAIEIRPTDARGYLELGYLAALLGRHAEAAESFRTATELAPGSVRAHGNLGATARIAGQFEEAEAALLRAIELDPEAHLIQEELSIVYRMQGRCDEAVDRSKKAIELNETYYRLRAILALAFTCEPGHREEEQSAWREAIRLAEDALIVNPNDLLLQSLLAGYWARVGDPQRALSQIEMIPQLARQSAQVRLQAANAFELAGRGDRAMAELEGVLRSGFRVNVSPYHGSMSVLRKNPEFDAVVRAAQQGE